MIKVEKGARRQHPSRRPVGRLPPSIGVEFRTQPQQRGICVDIGEPGGVDLIHRLVRDADVFVENFRPGVMERKGLGYEALRALNPRLVYCSITAFGRTGPLAQKPGMDLILQATGGIMAHTGEEGGPPIKSAPPVADLNTGVYGAYAILGALFARERTGEGQYVHVAMLDAVLSLFADNAVNVLTEGTHFGRFGSGHPDLVPYQAFPASDGYFIVACLTNAFFKRLCVALGREDWLNDPHMATNPARVERRAEVVEILNQIFKQNTCEHWIALLEQHDIPCCKVMPLHEILAHPQIEENALIHSHEDPVRGRIVTLGPPVQMSATPTAHQRVAPMLGEHTDEVLREFGLSGQEIAELRAANVIN